MFFTHSDGVEGATRNTFRYGQNIQAYAAHAGYVDAVDAEPNAAADDVNRAPRLAVPRNGRRFTPVEFYKFSTPRGIHIYRVRNVKKYEHSCPYMYT